MPRRAIPARLAQRVREVARHRCGYCLNPQHLVMAKLEIEHILPVAQGGADDETNLWLACPRCNAHKSDKTVAADPETGCTVPLFNPRLQGWSEHFAWADGGLRIVGLTAIGRATVAALHLSDDPIALIVRGYWITAGWHPPKD